MYYLDEGVFVMQTKKQLSIKGFVLPAIALCSLLFSWNAAHAALVTYSFTGIVQGSNVTLSPPFGIGQPMSGFFTVGGQPNNHITIRNLPAFDSAELVVNKLSSGALVNGFTPTKFDITLVDGTAGAFNSQYLTTVPSLSSFLTTNQWRLVFAPGGQVVQGALTSLTAVPLPAAVLLFGAGLISLVGLGAGGLRNLRGHQA